MADSTDSWDIFSIVKQVPTVEILRHYCPQIELLKRGQRWIAKCPFHADNNPSFIVFEAGNWRCFGCNEYGDSIDFVRKVADLSPIQAAKTIAVDFGLKVARPSIIESQKIQKAQENSLLEKIFKEMVQNAYFTLCEVYQESWIILDRVGAYGYSLSHVPYVIEMYLDILQYGTDEEKLNIFMDMRVKKWTKILQKNSKSY